MIPFFSSTFEPYSQSLVMFLTCFYLLAFKALCSYVASSHKNVQGRCY